MHDTLNVLYVENFEEVFFSFLACCINSTRSLLYCAENVYSCEGIGSAEFYSSEWNSKQGHVFSP